MSGGYYTNQCIPYEGNEHLLGTTEDCEERYKMCHNERKQDFSITH